MRWAVWVSAHQFQQITGRTRSIDRVFRRFETIEPELPFIVRLEFPAQVVLGLVFGVEDVVFPVGGGLPHVEDGVGDGGRGLGVGDGAVEEGEFAVGRHVEHAGVAEGAEGGVGRPEGAEDGGGGGRDAFCCGDLVVDFVDEAAFR